MNRKVLVLDIHEARVVHLALSFFREAWGHPDDNGQDRIDVARAEKVRKRLAREMVRTAETR